MQAAQPADRLLMGGEGHFQAGIAGGEENGFALLPQQFQAAAFLLPSPGGQSHDMQDAPTHPRGGGPEPLIVNSQGGLIAASGRMRLMQGQPAERLLQTEVQKFLIEPPRPEPMNKSESPSPSQSNQATPGPGWLNRLGSSGCLAASSNASS